MRIIERREIRDVLDAKWVLVYGRRKTGKTFYIRERGSVRREFLGRNVSEHPPVQVNPHEGLGTHQPQLPSGFIGE